MSSCFNYGPGQIRDLTCTVEPGYTIFCAKFVNRCNLINRYLGIIGQVNQEIQPVKMVNVSFRGCFRPKGFMGDLKPG